MIKSECFAYFPSLNKVSIQRISEKRDGEAPSNKTPTKSNCQVLHALWSGTQYYAYILSLSINSWNSITQYGLDSYPPFACGCGFVLTADLIDYLVKNAHLLKDYRLVDVAFGIYLYPIRDIQIVNDDRYSQYSLLNLTSKTITSLCGGTSESKDEVDTREKEAEAMPRQRFNAPEGVACQVIYTRCDGDSCFELAEHITRVFVADTGNSVIKVVDTIQNEVSSVRPLELDWDSL